MAILPAGDIPGNPWHEPERVALTEPLIAHVAGPVNEAARIAGNAAPRVRRDGGRILKRTVLGAAALAVASGVLIYFDAPPANPQRPVVAATVLEAPPGMRTPSLPIPAPAAVTPRAAAPRTQGAATPQMVSLPRPVFAPRPTLIRVPAAAAGPGPPPAVEPRRAYTGVPLLPDPDF